MDSRLIGIARLLVGISLFGAALMAYPVLAQRETAAIDAVQTEQIRALDIRLTSAEEDIRNTDTRITYIMGGIAGIYALIGLVGAFNIRVWRNK